MAKGPIFIQRKDGEMIDTGADAEGFWTHGFNDGHNLKFSDAAGNITHLHTEPTPDDSDDDSDSPSPPGRFSIPADGKWHQIIVRPGSDGFAIFDTGPAEDGEPPFPVGPQPQLQ